MAYNPGRSNGEVEQNPVRSTAVVDDLFDELFLRGLIGLLVYLIANEVDWSVGASARRREGADGTLPKFACTEVERQQAMRGSVREQDLFAQRGKRATDRRH